jgi:UDP-N-acetylmuramoyl-L-alanyl-D-glutamate--2,6-diaminopimelate ligase
LDNHEHCPSLIGVRHVLGTGVIHGDATIPITGIACNTGLGDVQTGSLFAPLDLSSTRTAALATRAVERGAAALLLEQTLDIPIPQLIVPHVRAALAQVAATFYGHPARELTCIGVTGTDGKTTTTLLIDSILRTAGRRPGLVGSLEWRVGDTRFQHQTTQTTPEAPQVQHLLRQMVDAGDRFAILEATSHGLALHRLDAVPFTIGAMTFVTQDHLDFHGSVAAYRRAKAILFERVADNRGVAILNADDPASRAMAAYASDGQVLFYSATGRPVDIRATAVEPYTAGTRFTLSLPSGSATLTLPLLGEFNVANALCAAGVAFAAGVSLAQIIEGLELAPPIPGLLTRVDAGQPFLVLIDEAKSVPQLVTALEVARQLTPAGRVIAVVGSSDGAQPGVVEQKGEVTALVADYAVFTTQLARKTDPTLLVAQLADSARAAGGIEDATFARVVDRRSAIAQALHLAGPGDCVLLTGKGVEDELTVLGTTYPWDEEGIARQILMDLGYTAGPGQEHAP